jgi:gamma-glutamyltranspeptidase
VYRRHRAGGARNGKAAIASAHPLASAAGERCALEAMLSTRLAISAALAAVDRPARPTGGGFYLLHRASGEVIDARETAPAARRATYLDGRSALPRLSRD